GSATGGVLTSFPTRRSSDLRRRRRRSLAGLRAATCPYGRGSRRSPLLARIRGGTVPSSSRGEPRAPRFPRRRWPVKPLPQGEGIDRKSTRLNSSHVKISYAV